MADGLLDGVRVDRPRRRARGDGRPHPRRPRRRGRRSSSRRAATRCARVPDRFAAWAAGKQSVVRRRRRTTPRSTRCSPAPTSCIDTPGFPGALDARSRARARRGVGERHAVRARRARAPTGARPTSASWRRAGTCTAPAIPTARRCAAPSRRATRTSAPRPRSPRSPGSRAAGRSASTSRCRRSCSSPTWRRRPASRRPGSAAGGGAPTSAGPARSGRRATGSCRFGLRGGKARVPSLETLTRLVDTARRCAHDGLDRRSRRTPRDDDDARARSRPTSPRTSPGTRCRSSTTSRARRTSCSPRSTRPREILASAQLAARDFFGPLGDVRAVPARS